MIPQEAPMKIETRALWELLFADFAKFQDYRHFKAEVGGSGPDFKHKQSGEGLWWVCNRGQQFQRCIPRQQLLEWEFCCLLNCPVRGLLLKRDTGSRTHQLVVLSC